MSQPTSPSRQPCTRHRTPNAAPDPNPGPPDPTNPVDPSLQHRHAAELGRSVTGRRGTGVSRGSSGNDDARCSARPSDASVAVQCVPTNRCTMNLFRTKTIEQSIADTEESEHQLRKQLGPVQLTVFGVGVIIGTGIFVLTGVAAHNFAGPAISLSFVFSGIACALAALCYAEFASTVPVAGSAYTFSYASIGEFFAWIIGWDLILEFIVGASTVSVGWSQYFNRILVTFFGVSLPGAITGGVVNLPAAAIALILMVILVIGIRLSSGFNFTVTAIKLAVVLFFIGFGIFFVNTANWSPFIPPAGGTVASVSTEGGGPSLLQYLTGAEQQAFGFAGIITAAAIVFFAYIGFDVVATTSEEARNPQRDLPIGILGSLGICTVLYILVSQIMTGIVPYYELDTEAPMAAVFQQIGQGWAAGLVAVGAICGLTSVIMILMLGQSRVA